MAGYTLPEMLMDLNSICEPFLNQSPSHAEYAKIFLENANEEIVKAVQDAQVAMQQQPDPGSMQSNQLGQHGHQQYVQQPEYPGLSKPMIEPYWRLQHGTW